jgi:tripartite-type tricarboxylate transporter receptor subunit TctC
MRRVCLILMMLSCVAPCLGAESYPNKPVRMIACFGAGSTVDFVARLLSQQMTEQLGKTFVVDNRTGASGTIGYGLLANAASDGYTLGLGEVGLTMVASLMKTLPYDVMKDFTPITQIIRTPMALVVNPTLNTRTLRELIAVAQANPGKYNYASVGAGTAVHMATELFKIAARIDVIQVPYKTGGEMLTGLIGNQTQMLLTTMPNVVTYVNSGKVRALAVTTEGKRSPALPAVPTMSEAGLPGVVIYTWAGLIGPASMPKPLVHKLHAETMKAIAMPAVGDRLVADGAEIVGSSPEEFGVLIRSELKRWSGVVKTAGITAE